MMKEKYIKELIPIFLHFAMDKEGTQSLFQGVQAAFVSKYPQHDYSRKVSDVNTITTLLENKAEMINNPNFNRFSIPDALDYVAMSEGYMFVSPKDEDAGSQIIKAGNTAKSIRGYGAKAVVLYDWLLQKQPDHPKAGQALFLKAFTYDNELNKKDVAEKLYKQFIATYPDDDFADDAQLLLDNLGKTDQEFYETIVKKKVKKNRDPSYRRKSNVTVRSIHCISRHTFRKIAHIIKSRLNDDLPVSVMKSKSAACK